MSPTLLSATLLLSALQAGGQATISPAGPQAPEPHIRFERATEVESALPQSSVYEIVQDEQGFLWFATREGLARWDGNEIRSWTHDPFDDNSIAGNVVRRVVRDARGDMWATTHNYLDQPAGISRIRAPRYDQVQTFHVGSGQVFRGAGDTLWLATADSLYRWSEPAERFSPVMPRVGGTGALISGASSADGALWLREAGVVERCVPGDVCTTVPSPTLEGPRGDSRAQLASRPYVDAEGRVWVGHGSSLARWNASTETWESEIRLPTGDQVVDLASGPDDAMWLLTAAGIYKRSSEQRWTGPYLLSTPASSPNLAPVDVMVDRAGTVWVGTVWGLYRYRPDQPAFDHLGHDPRDVNSLSEGFVVSLAEDSTGGIWIGTIGGGLNHWDRGTSVRRFRHRPDDPGSLPHDIVWSLQVDPAGDLWAGTGNGLARHDLRTGDFETHDFTGDPGTRLGSEGNALSEVLLGPSGKLWMQCVEVCSGQLHWFDIRADSFGVEEVPFPGALGYAAMGPRGRLWLGWDSGLLRATRSTDDATGEDTWTFEPFGERAVDGVLAFHFDSAGTVWVGSNTGLYRFAEDGQLLLRVSAEDGLPSEAVYGILEDDYGRLWLSTNRGLASLDPDAGAPSGIRTYDRSTGLRNVEFNRNAYLRSRDGTLFFGGDQGVTHFHPDRVRPSPVVPPVVLTAIEFAAADGTHREPYVEGTVVQVGADVSSVTFDVAALSYHNPHLNRHAVMMEGFDATWRELGTRRAATYTNLPPGNYTLRVQGASADGVWNREGASIAVVVLPAFWQTWWFQGAVGLAVLTLVAFVTWTRAQAVYRVNLARLRTQQTLAHERGRISRDMHDEVGASLTEIAMLTELATHGSEGDRGRTLVRIGEKSRATLDSIGEIVWALSPVNDEGVRFSAYLRAFAAEFLESMPARAYLDFPADPALPRVGAEVRRGVLLVLKEALANVARHAGASDVTVRMRIEDGRVRLEVGDDGAGFDPEMRTGDPGHEGLANMLQRARALDGTLSIQSRPGEGCRIVLDVPVQAPRAP